MKKLLFIPLLLICSTAFASPSISSLDGLTISGLSFSNNLTVSDIVFDGLEDGSGDVSPDIGTDWNSADNINVTSSGTMRTNDSLYQIQHNFTGSETCGFGGNTSLLSEKWLASYWFKLDNNWDWGDSSFGGGNQFLSNVKIFRTRNDGGVDENFVVATQGWNDNILWTNEYTGDDNGTLPTGTLSSISKNVWHNIVFEFKESSGSSVADGIIKIYLDGNLIATDSALKTIKDFNVYKRIWLMGFYNSWGVDAGSSLPDTIYFDDFYTNTSWARIEVGNNSVYGSCTHREVQPFVDSWGDTATTLTQWYQGSFTNYETAYLFVVDSDGTASDGYEGYFLDGTFYPAGEGPVATSSSISGAYSISGACSIS